MLYFEHVLDDGTAIRIVDIPDEALNLEVPTVQIRITKQGQKPRIVSFQLYDPDKKELLFDKLVDGVLQKRIEENGIDCENCGTAFIPHSNAQKFCDKCKELRG